MTKYISGALIVALAVGLAACDKITSPAGPITLCHDGKSNYQVVLPEKSSPVDRYAARILTNYLARITGAEFPVVAPEAMDPASPSLFMGMSAPALKHLGKKTMGKLGEQEYASRSIGQNIFLYGEGVHGNLHAVLDFLEQSLGWRWYSVYENPVIPEKTTLILDPFSRKGGFSYKSREVAQYWNPDFYYQNGLNMASEKWGRPDQPDSPYVPYLRNDKFVHNLFAYIPPTPDIRDLPATNTWRSFDWLPRKNYFETNPDFFSMVNSKRIPNKQLCFGNPGLRKEFTANVLRHIAAQPGNLIIAIDAADATDTFCYCPECKALEEKYGGPGGPIYDYLFEICDLLKKEHPGVYVKTLAYRRSQTQKPPVLPPGKKLPENLIVSFAPIDDNYFADWTHPDPKIQETYADLKAWSAITYPGNLWAWLYPNPFGTGHVVPVGNLERNINQMRLMYKAGVRGIFTDHLGCVQRSGLSELQSYLFYKLMKDIDCDTEAIIKEFTDHQYGPAADLARKYLAELEQGRKDMRTLPPGVTYNSQNFDDRTFPYLTVTNIHRWQGYFDQMEKILINSTNEILNVRILRRELDFATLWKWFDLKKTYPGYFKDHAQYADRIKAVNNATAQAGMKHRPMGEGALQDFLAVIQGGGQVKPLPAEFAGIAGERIKQYLPRNYGRDERKTLVDPEAAFGYVATVHNPDMPFQLGFYQWMSRNPPPGTPPGKEGARLKIEKDRITPGAYRLYELGKIEVTPDSWIWFSAQSWGTHLEVGDRLYEPGADNVWRAWVSMKFDGPLYGGAATNDFVLVDRIILVREGKGQFEAK
ncbi:MAG: DUF4838 domain-containing protein [Kiritimatiellia bacterium]